MASAEFYIRQSSGVIIADLMVKLAVSQAEADQLRAELDALKAAKAKPLRKAPTDA